MATGHLPTRQSVLDMPGFTEDVRQEVPRQRRVRREPGQRAKARPVLASYDQISQAMGQAIVAVLLGETESAGRRWTRRPKR